MVQKVEMLKDLTHIIWLSDKPVIITVGREVDFNELGDIIKPQLDNDFTLNVNVMYHKFWDFDGSVPPPLDNDGTPPDNDGSNVTIPINYAEYDYLYDSWIKYVNGVKIMDKPVHTFSESGLYKITLTGIYIKGYGYVERAETASRLLKVISAPLPPDNDGQP